MKKWLSKTRFTGPRSHPAVSAQLLRRSSKLNLEWLEAREVPAVTIQLDFSRDVSGFFNDPARQAILQSVANDVGSHLDANLPAISTPAGSSWSQSFYDPATGGQTVINNPAVAANTLTIYVGGRSIGGSEAGYGGSGGYSASGSQDWLNFLASRGPGGSLLWGGSITFDTGTNWWFGSTTTGMASNQVDFYSVASHELGHVLGIGTAPRWAAQSSGGRFNGPNAVSLYGGAVPLSPNGDHWADGVSASGQVAVMDPYLHTGTRISWTPLDYAGLKDLGWAVSGVPGVASGGGGSNNSLNTTPLSVAPVPVNSPALRNLTPTGTANSSNSFNLVALSGQSPGSVQIFSTDANGNLTSVGPAITPFPGFTGAIRSVIADFNGDGIADFAFGTGPGGTGQVRIINGATGTDLVPPTLVLDGFTGGVFLAAGDMDRSGSAELAVSADAGGGNRIQVFKVQNGQLNKAIDFMAFGDANFRGGSRVAMGDVNGDGAADLIVGAGIGGGPRVAIYDGQSLLNGQATKLVPDFFAFDANLRSGVFVTVADFNGDGLADIAYSTGNTGGPRVRIVSGATIMANPGSDMARLPALADFFVLDPNDRNGIRLAARDLNGDGQAELIVASGSKSKGIVRVISYAQMGGSITSLQTPFGDVDTFDGLYVG